MLKGEAMGAGAGYTEQAQGFPSRSPLTAPEAAASVCADKERTQSMTVVRRRAKVKPKKIKAKSRNGRTRDWLCTPTRM